jgi:hypothetical protein
LAAEKKIQSLLLNGIFSLNLFKMRPHLYKNIIVKIITFSSAAEFFGQIGRKVLPRMGNTDGCRPHALLQGGVLIIN